MNAQKRARKTEIAIEPTLTGGGRWLIYFRRKGELHRRFWGSRRTRPEADKIKQDLLDGNLPLW